MIIIAEINSLTKGLTDVQKKQIGALTAKDKFFLICDQNATVSMDILEMFMDLKVKPQFIKVDLKDKFALGYEYGILIKTYDKEKITVISVDDHSAVFGKAAASKNSTKAGSAAKKETVKKTVAAQQEGPSEIGRQVGTGKKTAEAGTGKPAKTAEKPGVKEPAAETKKKAAAGKKSGSRTITGLSNEALFARYPALSDYKEHIERMGEGMMKSAISLASDAEIGLKFQLTMVFGAEDGEAIWKILKKDFKKLKELGL